MMVPRKTLVLLSALFLIASCGKKAEQATRVNEVHTLEDATALAAKDGSFIVAEFYSPT